MPETQSQLKTGAQWLPQLDNSEVALAAPGEGPGNWVGASSAIEVDGEIYLAYRWRRPLEHGRGGGMVVAWSRDGVRFETVAEISKAEMDAESLERPALVVTDNGKW